MDWFDAALVVFTFFRFLVGLALRFPFVRLGLRSRRTGFPFRQASRRCVSLGWVRLSFRPLREWLRERDRRCRLREGLRDRLERRLRGTGNGAWKKPSVASGSRNVIESRRAFVPEDPGKGSALAGLGSSSHLWNGIESGS